jgi:hypothetical protein
VRFSELRHLADEDFDNRIVRGLLLRRPDLDVVRVQDVGLRRAKDPTILAFAATEGRVLLTHDVSTMPAHVEERLERGEKVPGIFEAQQGAPMGSIISDLMLLAECSFEDEWEGRILYLPL